MRHVAAAVGIGTSKVVAIIAEGKANGEFDTEWKDTLINDFEAIVFPQHPVIGEIKEELYHQGAIYASMSGSGSSVFGLFAPGFVLPEIDWGTDVFCFKGTLNK